ncbi:GGDEF domain-containing protein [Candidatus Woesearchaeota archaeon]|jgi:diguanylate cyclase (GGDEF)-like protein|nr:GGDEF domain-containing protein [Candidatus Woesearchaeota archaeon]MBT5272819.1 GGDEF domain-containing protein [Candidatus Woesearchaeota archaeon]MBT6040431.1 GGDEF domain-containing protein [Candidatus Woesearchaeota archaeon]MBT6336936.1 GGDEF domain-containing protein [Candidatus Woesearchaeota archaeon]MBT7926822.1 GGDEF domain-containing protein [Candidatus Woesearchaeota archaeon]
MIKMAGTGSDEINTFPGERTTEIHPDLQSLHFINIYEDDGGIGSLEDRIGMFTMPDQDSYNVLIIGETPGIADVANAQISGKAVNGSGKTYETLVNPTLQALVEMVNNGYKPDIAIIDIDFAVKNQEYKKIDMLTYMNEQKARVLTITGNQAQGFNSVVAGRAEDYLLKEQVAEGALHYVEKMMMRKRETLMRLKTQELAMVDELTQIYNRRYGVTALQKEIKRVQRHAGMFSFFFFDIDNFKNFNDTYGHDAGNDVLRNISRQMLGCFRGEDIAARFGGEEFMVIMPETTYAETSVPIKRFEEALKINPYVSTKGVEVPITISGSVVSYGFLEKQPQEHPLIKKIDFAAIFKAADIGMYICKSKRIGKNHVLGRNVLQHFYQNKFDWEKTEAELCGIYKIDIAKYKSDTIRVPNV